MIEKKVELYTQARIQAVSWETYTFSNEIITFWNWASKYSKFGRNFEAPILKIYKIHWKPVFLPNPKRTFLLSLLNPPPIINNPGTHNKNAHQASKFPPYHNSVCPVQVSRLEVNTLKHKLKQTFSRLLDIDINQS